MSTYNSHTVLLRYNNGTDMQLNSLDAIKTATVAIMASQTFLLIRVSI